MPWIIWNKETVKLIVSTGDAFGIGAKTAELKGKNTEVIFVEANTSAIDGGYTGQ
ncbi:hypothetical protein [Planococcus sp. NCCP-2050]|uniref:hypothetical protein n=1 Tax=Planococcus sp. NCCP-2050 TaxID=2944679 RepID=UPI002041C58B|nr:hypothetical protein [Planococcus sp. NCCP-2050]GKW47339.1 hypothetical protein NCCP2050_30310 [Planococcus sp. NCCP-2050]